MDMKHNVLVAWLLNRSSLVAIIGFLCGLTLSLLWELPKELMYVGGLGGYLIGLFLDHADTKHQIQTQHFSAHTPLHQRFTLDSHPHATVIYSARENVTAVILYYQVTEKPTDFRLSVIKNLRDFQFRISERDTNTRIGIELTYPEFNYPHHAHVGTTAYQDFLFDVEEKGRDFQTAFQKVVPGLTLLPELQSDFAPKSPIPSQSFTNRPQPPPAPAPPSFPSSASPPVPREGSVLASANPSSFTPPPNSIQNEIPLDDSRDNFRLQQEDPSDLMSEQNIMEDLLGEESPGEPALPHLPAGEVEQLPASNERAFQQFLEEDSPEESADSQVADPDPPSEEVTHDTDTDETPSPVGEEIEIDFSAVGAPTHTEENSLNARNRFNQDISAKFNDFEKERRESHHE